VLWKIRLVGAGMIAVGIVVVYCLFFGTPAQDPVLF
jgi:hypothetical protein